MGKGIIKSGGADGFYNVELTFERDRIDKTIAAIDAHIESLTSVIDTMDEGTEKELLKLERNSYIKKKEYLLNNMPEDPTVSAWCADLTEDITGNVGTIEVPGERGIVQIQPGYEGNSIYNATRDGQLQPSIASTPAATFYNLALLPGWQKWKPTYRYGVISNIDTDANTCDVKLDEAESSQQNLNINQELNLTGISISYMSCDSVAFEDGDNVLVKFEGQTWDGAQVVGFKNNPKACDIRIKLYRGDGVLITGWYGGEEQGDILTLLYLRNSNDDWIAQTVTYDPETQYWTLSVDNDEDKDSDGYWIIWQSRDGRLGNYPYRYFPVWDDVGATSNLRQVEDLVKGGSHVDIIPYFTHTTFIDPTEYCDVGNISFLESSQKWIVCSSSVDYYVRYRVPSRESVAGFAINCQGRGWELSCSEFNYTIPADGIIPSEISAFESSNINVQINQDIADDIINELGSVEKFNAQFPSISIGDNGILTDTFIADFIEGGIHEIAIATFNMPIPYTLQF